MQDLPVPRAADGGVLGGGVEADYDQVAASLSRKR